MRVYPAWSDLIDAYHDANGHEDTVGSEHASGMDDDQWVCEVSTGESMSMRVDIVHMVHGAEFSSLGKSKIKAKGSAGWR